MSSYIRSLCLFLFSIAILFSITGCSLIALPFIVTEEVLGDTGIVVMEVGEAL